MRVRPAVVHAHLDVLGAVQQALVEDADGVAVALSEAGAEWGASGDGFRWC